MVSDKLKNYFFISIPFFVAHETEELVTAFWEVDPLTNFVASFFADIPQALFIAWNFEFLLFLIIIALLLRGEMWILRIFTVFGLLFLLEFGHLVRVFLYFEYYPGMITAFPLLIIGFFFWKELVRCYRIVGAHSI